MEKPKNKNISKMKDDPNELLKTKDLNSDKMPYPNELLKIKELTIKDDKPHILIYIRQIQALRHPQIPC